MHFPVRQRRTPLRPGLVAVCAALLVAGGSSAQAARWDDPAAGALLLRSYTARETGTLAPYRCTLRTRDGQLYVGHDGLIEFDGETWRAMPVPVGCTVRTLAEADDGRIWVGGDGLLGFLTRSDSQPPTYTSALPSLPPGQRAPAAISAIFVLPHHTIVAVADNRVFCLRETDVQVWSLPAPRRLSAWREADGSVYITQPDTGTHRVTVTGLEPAGVPEPYNTIGVDWRVSLPDHSAFFGSGGHVLRERAGTCLEISGPTADLLQGERVTSAIPLAGGFAALATLRHGILVLDSDGRVVSRLDRTSGMPDNRIVHLAASKDHGIVATTPEAVVQFCDELRASYFDARHGLSAKRIHAIQRTDDGLFVAGDNALLQLAPFAAGADSSALWQVSPVQSQPPKLLLGLPHLLLGAGPGGLGIVGPHALPPIPGRTGDIVALSGWSDVSGGLAWIEDSRFFRGTLDANGLALAGQPLELNAETCSLVEDSAGAHWVATRQSEVLRIASAGQIRNGKPAIRAYRNNLRPAAGASLRLLRVGPYILASTDAGLAIHSDASDRFEPVPGITNVRIHALSGPEADGSAWVALSQRNRYPLQVRIAHLRPEEQGVACELVQLPPIPLEDAPTALFAEPTANPGERVFWLGFPGRLVRIESSGKPAENPPVTPRISALSVIDSAHDTSAQPLHTPAIGFDNAGIRFDITVPDGRRGRRVHLETRLPEVDADWVPLGEMPSRVFRGLRDRTYHFQARTIDALGRPSAVAGLEFTVLPPWWRSAPAYASYALALVLFSALVFYTRLRLARAHRRELEELVARRTRELAEANAAKSEFLAHINHEIRNPLNGVVGLSAMLAERHQDEGSRQLARSLKACAGYLGSVVDNVLDLARIEAGRIEISNRRFEPRRLIEEIAEMFRLQIEEAGGRVSWSVDPDLPDALVGDVHRIRQVLVNFTANAARYARGGDVRLSARRRAQTQNRVSVVFTVADTGPGIAPDEQSRIFEKFARGGRSAEPGAPRGYGVGLALVRDLAALLGGEADVDSQLGHGAKFRLTIPLDIATTAAAIPALATAATPGASLRVLVIDDQAFNRLVLRDHLERLGCKVEESSDGLSAHLLLQARAHHLAFVDLDLPGLDGLALISRIRAAGTTPRAVFLVATTASATRGIEEKVLAAGADAFLPKPISLPHLAGLLEACAARQATTSPTAPMRPAAPSAAPRTVTGEPTGGLFAELPFTPDLLRSLHAELDVETQSLIEAWRQSNSAATHRHAHRLASLAILARDEDLLHAARQAEESLMHDRAEASRSVDALQLAARERIRRLGAEVANHGKN